jgi:hypothetical protein
MEVRACVFHNNNNYFGGNYPGTWYIVGDFDKVPVMDAGITTDPYCMVTDGLRIVLITPNLPGGYCPPIPSMTPSPTSIPPTTPPPTATGEFAVSSSFHGSIDYPISNWVESEVQVASPELRRSVIGIATKQVNASATILSRSFNQSPSFKPSKVIGFSEFIHESKEFNESGTLNQSNEFPMSVLPNISDIHGPSKVIGFSELVHESRELNESGTLNPSNGFSFSALPTVSHINEPSNVIGFSDFIHESREFTESGPFSQSNGFSFSALPTVSHFNEASNVIGFSDFVHQSRQFVQSAIFSSRASVNELPETAANSQGLSDGALVGIIVGVVSFLAVLICLIVLRFFQNRINFWFRFMS